jgi:hypothetical protein
MMLKYNVREIPTSNSINSLDEMVHCDFLKIDYDNKIYVFLKKITECETTTVARYPIDKVRIKLIE